MSLEDLHAEYRAEGQKSRVSVIPTSLRERGHQLSQLGVIDITIVCTLIKHRSWGIVNFSIIAGPPLLLCLLRVPSLHAC